MPDINRPRYVNRWGFNGSPQPFAAKRVTSSCFVLEGKLSHLEDLCHRFFAEPTGGQIHYRPLTQYVVLTFNQMESVACEDPPYSRTGSGSETEVAFWVLTAAVERMAGIWVAQRLAWFVPYIFVDNSPNLIAGREIYGFPKEIGWFEIPANPGHAQRFSVEATVTKRFGPHARAERAQLLGINRTGAPGKRKSERWTNLEAVGGHVRAALFDAKSWVIPGVHFLEELASDFIHHQGPLVFLKQSYDIADGEFASFQSIVEAVFRVTAFRGGASLDGNYVVDLPRFDSHPIGRDLGLAVRQPAVLSYWLDFDFVIDKGTTIWTAPQPGPPQG